MKKNNLIIILNLFLVNNIFAQKSNPGYMGNKNCLSFGTRQYITLFRDFKTNFFDIGGELNYEIVNNRKVVFFLLSKFYLLYLYIVSFQQ